MNSLVEQFGKKGVVTIYGMTLCALLGVFHVDVAVIAAIAGLVTVFNGADTAISRGYAKVQQAQAQQAQAEATATVTSDLASMKAPKLEQ